MTYSQTQARLDRFHAIYDHLPTFEDKMLFNSFLLGWLSARTSDEDWDSALKAALQGAPVPQLTYPLCAGVEHILDGIQTRTE